MTRASFDMQRRFSGALGPSSSPMCPREYLLGAGPGDLPVVLGTVLVAAFFVVVANVIVDIAYAVLDPRVRLS